MTSQEGGAMRRPEAMEASVDGMAILDPDDEYVYVNQAHADIYGYDSAEDFVGNTWRMLYDEEEGERIENEVFPELDENGEWRGEATGVRADGTQFPQELSLSRLDDGGLVCVVRDITERKEREKELERYEMFVETSPDVIVHLGDDGTVLYTSPPVERVLGYGQEEMVGENAFDYVHPEDREKMMEAFASAVKGEDTGEENTPFRVEHADGSYIWVENAGADASSEPHQTDEGVVLSLRDITERKEREKDLERYKAFVENSSDSITHLDEEGYILYRSPSSERVEDEPEDMTGTHGFDHIHPDDRERVSEKFFSLLSDPDKSTDTVEYRSERADGSYEWVEAVATDQRDTEVGGVVVNTRVIDERKKREEELERYEAFVESSADVITHIDEDGTVLYSSPSVEDVFGYTQEETVGENAFDYVHPEDRERMIDLLESVVEGEDTGDENTEFRVEHADGSYVWVEDAGGEQTDVDLDGSVLNLRDVTERKEREKELERYEAFVENSLDVFSVLDEEGRHIYNSPSVERILGYDPDEHTGEYSLDYVHPDDMSNAVEWFYSLVDGNRSINKTQIRYRAADGSYVWFEIIGKDKRDTEVGGVIFNGRDITERKEREKELREQQRVLDTVASNMPVVVFSFDKDGVFTRSRGKALEEIGLESGEAVGESIFEMYENEPEIIGAAERALAGERTRNVVDYGGTVFETWYEPLTDEDGSVTGVVGLAYDVTEREEREKELERYEAFIEHSSDVVTLVEIDGTLRYYSPSVEVHAGHGQEERIGDNIYDYIHPDDRKRVMRAYTKLLKEPDTEVVEEEFRYQKGDGSYIWVESHGTDQRDTDLGGIVVNSRDITERKEREKELEKYEAFVENSSDVITHIDEDGEVLYQSPAAERILGRDPSEREGESALKYIHPEDREEVAEKLETLLNDPDETRLEVEFRSQVGDGSYVWLETLATDRTDTEFGGVVANSRDVTERKRNKKELERSRDLLKHTERIADTGGWEFDVEKNEIRWTEGAENIHVLPTDDDMTPEEVFEFYHPEDREDLRRAVERCIKEGEPYDMEIRLDTEDDTDHWLHTNGVAVREDGRTVKVRGALQDVTERKEREEELRSNRELLKHTERIADTGGWELDKKTNDLRWTEGTRNVHDLPDDYEPAVEEAIEFYHPEDKERIWNAVERCLEGEPFDEELRLITAEDELRWVRSLGEPVVDDGEVVELRGAIQDITERRERERRLRKRKEQIDFFNSLLRHDMLNSMTVISGNAERLEEELSDDERELAEKISKHSKEIVDLTERVRSVLRRLTEEGTKDISPMDISELVEERCESLEETYPRVDCRVKTDGGVRVMADSFLHHVLDNVLVNAVEHNDKDEPRVEVTVEGDEDKETATVRVADNGPGIPDENKDTIFDQGTTGRSSGGVGFGLYYVEAMVSEYGGDVHVEDNDPEGTVVVIELPKAEAEDVEEREENEETAGETEGEGGWSG